ncbi:Uncharacterised protein [Yersinia thracica]|uniref:Uncharacterized protein n=1 Tax=Yersinia thracica TaxID=2890319 RepID=A0A0T9NG91_9GAMM|nr:hypothetical protein [Yersinia thracica]CNH06939.1 Uncharacterised protein [Yersinia thracica]
MKKKSKVTAGNDIIHPLIDAFDPAVDLTYTIDGILPSGYISRDAIANGVIVNVDPWAALKNGDKLPTARNYPRVYVTLDDSDGPNPENPATYLLAKGNVLPVWTADEIANGFSLVLDKTLLTEERHFIILFLMPVDGNNEQGIPVSFNLLKSPSGGTVLPQLKFDVKYHNDGITKSNLVVDPQDPNKEILPATLVAYFKQRDGDVITLFVGDSIATLSAQPVTVEIGANESGQNKALTFDSSSFEDGLNGPRYFAYTITNPAGFISAMSEPTILQLAFGVRPIGLQKPVLPEIKNNLILDQFIHPLHIDIPIYDNPGLGDVINVFFKPADDLASDGKLISTSPGLVDLTKDPIYSAEAIYNQIAPFDQKSVVIYYIVSSGGSPLLNTTSSALTIPVDLRISGGPNPDQPAKENGNLKTLIITSGDGELNKITGPAVLKDAEIKIPFKTVADSTYLEINDVISVTLGKTTITYPALSTVPAADVIEVLTVQSIKDAGEGDMTAQYTIVRKLPDGINSSESLSRKTDVFITSNNSNPGGKDGLHAPHWANKNDRNAINVSSVSTFKGCIFSVNRYENIAIGQIIQLKFRGTEGYGDPNGPAKPDASYDSDPLTITQNNIDNPEFEFLVPPLYIYNLCEGVAHVSYEVIVGGIPFGSAALLTNCDVTSPSSGLCILPDKFK